MEMGDVGIFLRVRGFSTIAQIMLVADSFFLEVFGVSLFWSPCGQDKVNWLTRAAKPHPKFSWLLPGCGSPFVRSQH